jgi:energy-coupling factor transporter ATP-binding protein EcfA2
LRKKKENHPMQFEQIRLVARGRLAACRQTIEGFEAAAAGAVHWTPATVLQAECRAALEMVDRLEQRLDRKLVVTLVGPTGSGKSTLLNALAGSDELSPTGIDRPTTRQIVVFCRRRTDADELLGEVDPGQVVVRLSPDSSGLQQVVLVDSPDMDSIESAHHRPLLEKTIRASDVLICVLNGENPKRRDAIAFLKPFVDHYPGSLLYVALNRCDRLPADELRNHILPDLNSHLQQSWQSPVRAVFCISARRHLLDPNWPEDEQPLHENDDYPQLRAAIFENLNRDGRLVDARIERAEHLAGLVRDSAHSRVAEVNQQLQSVRSDIDQMEAGARLEAIQAMQTSLGELRAGMQAMFYQNLAGRWWGPVGWLVGMWARFLMAGAGALAVLRIGNPALQLWGLASALLRRRKTRAAVEEAVTGGDWQPALLKYRLAVQRTWPEIADKLIAAGFQPVVRSFAAVVPKEGPFTRQLTASWRTALETTMDRRAAGLSGFILQLLFNLPTLALMGLFGYRSVEGFLLNRVLPPGYFLHASVSIALVWLLSFVLLQVAVRFGSGKSLFKRAFDRLLKQLDGAEDLHPGASIREEIEIVLRLAEMK